ncbi:MAG: hypothetical protein O7D29_02620 [Gemmatimonadetes bacterium]|nr:hypothetical protein [Gemmatimonadota bacterium]
MARRSIEVRGENWWVYPGGGMTSHDRDEFAIVFEKGSGSNRVRRVTRYRPTGDPRCDTALAQLSDAELCALFDESQTALTSPQTNYELPSK